MKYSYTPKPLFVERMKELLGKAEYGRWKKAIEIPELRSIRVNTLKISVAELKKRLENKGWVIKQPYKDFSEIFVIEGKIAEEENSDDIEDKIDGEIKSGDENSENNGKMKSSNDNLTNNKINEQNDLVINPSSGRAGGDGGGTNKKIIDLEPGELGRALEHLLGYYYVQEIASMLPAIVLNPKSNEKVLDLCAAPGSKTTQMAAMMRNKGILIANEVKMDRLKILASNLERCGAANTVVTKKDGIVLCRRFKEQNMEFDKILVDAPCSGEGTIKSTPKTLLMWNINTIKSLSKLQKKLLESAIEILKVGGEIVYSTCTHAPEENEGVLDYVLEKFGNKIKIEKINLPVKFRPGILKWKDENYNKDLEKACRIYPHVSNTEGFFVAKLRRMG